MWKSESESHLLHQATRVQHLGQTSNDQPKTAEELF